MRVGVLIIGSLLWDNGCRTQWRATHVRVEDGLHVKVPIRYGRKSTSRGDTFTMVLAPGGPLGQAVLVPCAATIDDSDSLVAEAEALWKAERSEAKRGEIGCSWGCVGALFRDPCSSLGVCTSWTGRFRERVTSPTPPVGCKGLLVIPWPTVDGGTPADFDVILGVATKGQASPPTPEAVADAWVDRHNGQERYFFENVHHGIRSSDDGLIWARIESKQPSWLACPAYTSAIAMLRAEARSV